MSLTASAAVTCYAVGQPELSRIESGRTNPTDKELETLASVFGCAPERPMDHVG